MQTTTAVIGLGQFGSRLVRSLVQRRVAVIAIDSRMDRVEKLSDVVERALCVDATDEQALVEAGVEQANVAVCALGEDAIQASIMVTALLAQLGVPRIIARGITELQSRILLRVGAHEVINPEWEMGERLAIRLANPNLLEEIPLAENISIAEVAAPITFVGKTLVELQVRKRFGVTVVAVRHPEGVQPRMAANPAPDLRVQSGDVLFVLGDHSQIQKVAEDATVLR
ncbi:MAG: TrkA family potassium uptake protein [Polyangiaceae bacterium]|jgi:trk system potassium uptake protein TrkA|nr:TrkA family potassium uptake protein [Polyangiaceae bacterium]